MIAATEKAAAPPAHPPAEIGKINAGDQAGNVHHLTTLGLHETQTADEARSGSPLTELGYVSIADDDEFSSSNEPLSISRSQPHKDKRLTKRRSGGCGNTFRARRLPQGRHRLNPEPGTFLLPPVPAQCPTAPARRTSSEFIDEDRVFFVNLCMYELAQNPNATRASMFRKLEEMVRMLTITVTQEEEKLTRLP